jgi:hypothetical protein
LILRIVCNEIFVKPGRAYVPKATVLIFLFSSAECQWDEVNSNDAYLDANGEHLLIVHSAHVFPELRLGRVTLEQVFGCKRLGTFIFCVRLSWLMDKSLLEILSSTYCWWTNWL